MKPDKTFISLVLLIILTIYSWISSCTHKTDTANIPEICFKEVRTIIMSNCSMENSGCHDGNGEGPSLITPEDIHRTVVPYNADKSTLYKVITSVRGENQMPPDQPISEELRSTIRFWIEQGADTLACAGTKRTGKYSDDRAYNK
jgi:hypothetical protein